MELILFICLIVFCYIAEKKAWSGTYHQRMNDFIKQADEAIKATKKERD